MTQPDSQIVFLVEDDSGRSNQRIQFDLQHEESAKGITVRVHKIVDGEWKAVYSQSRLSKRYSEKKTHKCKQTVAIELLNRYDKVEGAPIIVAGASYGCSSTFVKSLIEKELQFIVEIRSTQMVEIAFHGSWIKCKAADVLRNVVWRDVKVAPRNGKPAFRYSVADLAETRLSDDTKMRLFAAQTGGIRGLHPGTIIGLTTLHGSPLEELIKIIGWVRWIRPLVRSKERNLLKSPSLQREMKLKKSERELTLSFRSNISLAKLQDANLKLASNPNPLGRGPRGASFASANVLNVVELFAGAGGMGLGFLMAQHPSRRYRLLFAGELHPIYVKTLKNTHDLLIETQRPKWYEYVPESVEPFNLDDKMTLELVESVVKNAGGIDILVGGPPCQGFSSANRNSWSSTNPHNKTVGVFLRYVEKLKPPIFLIENVQGIAWTAKQGNSGKQPSVARHIVERMDSAGYVTFPMLLDAVWYGVPQFRTRFFVLGIHKDTGYCVGDFSDWGPFPVPTYGPTSVRPFITVRDAIGDLPSIGNGHRFDEMEYCDTTNNSSNEFLQRMRTGAPKKHILDHITSRHASYVIERYKQVPAGGNWQDIVELMSNYSQLDRTHSNIYRRLEWDKPSITIGHFRKSMLIHPEQHRGLSLREASRLQSFPDWFRFAGTMDGKPGGLVHKQQQLANAVCPLVSKAIAEYILEL